MLFFPWSTACFVAVIGVYVCIMCMCEKAGDWIMRSVSCPGWHSCSLLSRMLGWIFRKYLTSNYWLYVPPIRATQIMQILNQSNFSDRSNQKLRLLINIFDNSNPGFGLILWHVYTYCEAAGWGHTCTYTYYCKNTVEPLNKDHPRDYYTVVLNLNSAVVFLLRVFDTWNKGLRYGLISEVALIPRCL